VRAEGTTADDRTSAEDRAEHAAPGAEHAAAESGSGPVGSGRIDEPARSDGFVRGLSEAIGGPLGEHAVRPPRSAYGGSRFWTPVRIVMALAFLTLSLHWVQKSPCRDGAWSDLSQYKYFCYTDVLALYYAEHLNEGKVPYAQHAVEYPVLTGAFMGAIGLPVYALNQRDPSLNPGRAFYDLNALVLSIFGIATVAVILALRRRRPWDAAMFALAPGLFVSATVNWDLFAVGLTALFMYFWARRILLLPGLFLGLATAAKFYPLLLAGVLLALAIRTNRWRETLATIGTAAFTWLVINGPVALLFPANWREFFHLNRTRGIDWGTLWYIGEHLPLGGGRYGVPWFQTLNQDPNHNSLNALYFGLFLIACGLILMLAIGAPRRPRFAQLAFLVVAAFLVLGKVWSQQYVLWLLPLAVLARPRWGAFLAWQAAEVGYFLAFYGELMGASGHAVFPEWVFVFAAILRLTTVCVLAGFVVRDILYPERDQVRRTYDDDPDGGVFEHAPDARYLSQLRFWQH
jgi:uncharacterized membrane protein